MTARNFGLIDMTGERHGSMIIVQRVRTEDRQAWWLCRYDCGHEQVRLGVHLREQIRRGSKFRCQTCAGIAHAECSICHDSTHNRTNCPKRKRRAKYCEECFGLPWRRPHRGVCACAERWAPEPAVQRPDPYRQNPLARWA